MSTVHISTREVHRQVDLFSCCSVAGWAGRLVTQGSLFTPPVTTTVSLRTWSRPCGESRRLRSLPVETPEADPQNKTNRKAGKIKKFNLNHKKTPNRTLLSKQSSVSLGLLFPKEKNIVDNTMIAVEALLSLLNCLQGNKQHQGVLDTNLNNRNRKQSTETNTAAVP